MKNDNYLYSIKKSIDEMTEKDISPKRIIMNPSIHSKLMSIDFKPIAFDTGKYIEKLYGLDVVINGSIDNFLIDDGYPYESWIEKHIKSDLSDDWINGEMVLTQYIRIPFFVDKSLTELDWKIIEDMNLMIYSNEGTEIFGDDNTKEAMKFKWVNVSYITKDEMFDEMIEISKRKFIQMVVDGIYKVLDTKKLIHSILGYCDKCEDCQGHKCGTITYHIDDFCRYDFDSHKLRAIKWQ